MMCRYRLQCGHCCPRQFHTDDSEHRVQTQCAEDCVKMLPCGHPCNRECSMVCDPSTCDEQINVTLQPCEHILRVNCRLSFFNKLPRCLKPVNTNFPRCGHWGIVECWENQLIRDVTDVGWSNEENIRLLRLCFRPCGEQRDCGHTCQRNCSDCRVASATSGTKTHHGKCPVVCTRLLICGHECGALCHEGQGCQPCTKKCQEMCEHSICPLKCSELCPTCVATCNWKCASGCPNERKCPLLCGDPCARLPCDRRCSKTLTCGHQCPSLCGEPCPTSEYCREPGCAPLERRDQVVDMVLMTTLNNHDPNESPLIVLPCGHCYSMKTLDGYCQINKFYSRDDKDWVSIVPLQKLDEVENIKLQCFECRHPVGNVNRYKRILKRTSISLMKQKHSYAEGQRSKSVMDELAALENLIENGPVSDRREAVSNAIRDVEKHAKESVSYVIESEPVHKLIERNQVAWAKKLKSEDALPHNLVNLDKMTPSSLPIVKSYQVQFYVVVSILGITERLTYSSTHRDLYSYRNNRLKNQIEDLIFPMVDSILKVQFPEVQTRCRQSKLERREIELCRTALVIVEGAMRMATRRRTEEPIDKIFLDLADMPDGILASLSSLGKSGETEISSLQLHLLPNIIEMKQQRSNLSYSHVSRDEKRMIFETMGRDVGTGVGSFGGHWYECPNGHVYTIGECGGAMQQSKCPECNLIVGGSNHQLSSQNRTADQFLRDVSGPNPTEQNS